jgi:hypothetical protein
MKALERKFASLTPAPLWLVGCGNRGRTAAGVTSGAANETETCSLAEANVHARRGKCAQLKSAVAGRA